MDFFIRLNDESKVPLYRQLYTELKKLILTKRLISGQRLPSTRYLAKTCNISRNTVNLSYEELQSEGYIYALHGSGTYVSEQPPNKYSKHSFIQCIHSHD